jgi:hypothetical protein
LLSLPVVPRLVTMYLVLKVCSMQLVRPFWIDNPDRKQPLLALGGVVVLSLMTTGVSVVFNFLGRDFFNALSSKNEAEFYQQLVKYFCGFAIGIPVFVFRDYFLVRTKKEVVTQKRIVCSIAPAALDVSCSGLSTQGCTPICRDHHVRR